MGALPQSHVRGTKPPLAFRFGGKIRHAPRNQHAGPRSTVALVGGRLLAPNGIAFRLRALFGRTPRSLQWREPRREAGDGAVMLE